MPLASRKIGFVVLAVVALSLLTLHSAAAAGRLALVLGNSNYQNVPALENPANDAGDFAAALRGLGFDVIEQRDASREAMAQAVHDFSEKLPGAEMALFFYAGHGLQMNGENYLIPVDARIQSAADVRFNTINLTDIQGEMESGGRTNIIILDACRDNPFADKLAQAGRSLDSRGLVRLDAAAQGSLIVYSTQPNNIALDGAGRPMLRQTPIRTAPAVSRRRYVTYHYNPAWQAAPGDTSCCPNNMLVCPLGRHFCGQ